MDMMRVMVTVMVAELAEVPVLVDMVELMEVIVDQVKILLTDEDMDMEAIIPQEQDWVVTIQ